MAKEIVIKEKELNINIIIVAKKNGSKNDSNLRFFFKLWVASNLVIKICEEHAKITDSEKIFVKCKITAIVLQYLRDSLN